MSSTRKAIIRTVLGDIDPAQLGLCLAHEHLLGRPPGDAPPPDLILDSEAAAAAELARFHAAGGGALVEMTTPDYGREARRLHRLAAVSGVHIVAATGFNKEDFSGPFLRSNSVAELTACFVEEIRQGMDGSRARAGVIKAASTLNDISPLAEKLFGAAAAAHEATGAPISTHTEAGTMALGQVALLREGGVPPEKIIIGHCDRRLDWPYLKAVAETGVFMGFDQISKEKYGSDGRRAEFIAALTAAGHGSQILLAGDLARRSYWPAYGNETAAGFAYVLEQFVPLLVDSGVDATQVDTFLRHNPARALAFVPRV